MMDPVETSSAPAKPSVPDSMDLVSHARSLHRKLLFWRRTAWLLAGFVAIVLLVVWQRGETRKRECQAALESLARIAREEKLAQDTNPLLLEIQWHALPSAEVTISPTHYDIIAQNWLAKPTPGGRLPLAVCRTSHLSLFGDGRNVLWRDEHGEHAEWAAEKDAAPILQAALRDNRHR